MLSAQRQVTEGAQRYLRHPKLEVLEITDERCRFVLSNTDVSMANSLRRIMIAEVPTIAVDLVTILENTSVHQDEILAHRFGLLPINSRNVDRYLMKGECTCVDKCETCSVTYQLDAYCDADSFTITHHSIATTQDAPAPMPILKDGEDPEAGIVIAKLRKGQRVSAELIAVKGIAKVHAKWSPVATCVFTYEPIIQIDREMAKTVSPAIKRKIVNSCPRKVFALKTSASAMDQAGDSLMGGLDEDPGSSVFDQFGGFDRFGNPLNQEDLGISGGGIQIARRDITTMPPGAVDIEVVDRNACIFCQECTKSCAENGFPGLIKVSHCMDRFTFIVESTGALKAKRIVKMALKIFEEKIAACSTSLMQISAAQTILGPPVISGGAGGAGMSMGAARPLDLS